MAATALSEHSAYPRRLLRRDNVTGAALTLSQDELTELTELNSIAR